MKIRHDSSIPLYQQIKNYLRKHIQSGDYPSHSRLPSERKLAHQFGVSRLTVTKALKELEYDGWVYTQIGKGTYVATQSQIQHTLESLTSFTALMSSQNKRVKSHVLAAEVIPVDDAEIAAALQINPGDMIFRLERLRLADDQIIALEKAHLPYIMCPDIEQQDFETVSLYEVLNEMYGVQLMSAKQMVEARLADTYEAGKLHIATQDAVLSFTRTTMNQHGVPIEFVQSVYPGDRYKFMIELKPNGTQVISTSEG